MSAKTKMKLLKQEEFDSGMEVLFDYEGKTHEGIVEVEGKRIFICQDVVNGFDCKNKHGKNYSYALCDEDGSGFMMFDYYDDLKNIRLKLEAKKKGKSVKKKAVKPVVKYDYEKFKVNKKECVSAKTEEDAVKITDKLKELGGCWPGTYFSHFKEKTVYYPQDDELIDLEYAISEGHKIITCDEWLDRFNGAPAKPAPKYVFETQFKLNGQNFDIVAHREKIARLKAELKEWQEIEKAFVKFNGGK